MSVKSCAAPGLLVQLPSTCLKPAVPCSGFPNSAVRSTPCTSFPFAFIWRGWEEGVVPASCSDWPGRHSPCGGGTRQMLPITISLRTESCYRSTLLPANLPFSAHCFLFCPLPLSRHVGVLQGGGYHPPWKCCCASRDLVAGFRL